MLSARDLTCLASDVATVLPDTVSLTRPASASDGLGGRSNVFALVGTYAARITPINTQQAEEEVGARLSNGTAYRVALPAGTDVRQTDRITYSSVTYSVEAVRAPRSVEVERVVYVKKV
jgi:hypothetical protein